MSVTLDDVRNAERFIVVKERDDISDFLINKVNYKREDTTEHLYEAECITK